MRLYILIYGIKNKLHVNFCHTNIHLSKIIFTFSVNVSDVEDTFCVMCGGDPCVWDIDKYTVTDLFNATYLGVKVKGSLVERK